MLEKGTLAGEPGIETEQKTRPRVLTISHGSILPAFLYYLAQQEEIQFNGEEDESGLFTAVSTLEHNDRFQAVLLISTSLVEERKSLGVNLSRLAELVKEQNLVFVAYTNDRADRALIRKVFGDYSAIFIGPTPIGKPINQAAEIAQTIAGLYAPMTE